MTYKIKVSEVKGYANIHHWLSYHYGKAYRCENLDCLKISKVFQWALLKGEEYGKNRESFIQLCRICHNRYDTPEIRLTHCLHGHEYSKKNTNVKHDGRWRKCRTCQNTLSKKWQQENKKQQADIYHNFYISNKLYRNEYCKQYYIKKLLNEL